MAMTIQEFSKAIRASVDDPEGNVLLDVTRLHAYVYAAITRYGGENVPAPVADMAAVQLGQYLYDADVTEFTAASNAMARSGARAMLAPYRSHHIGVDSIADGVSRISGLDRDAIIDIMREVLNPWVFQGSREPLPLDQVEVSNVVRTATSIVQLREFENAMRTFTPIVTNHLIAIGAPLQAYELPGNPVPSWPADEGDREIKAIVNPVEDGRDTAEVTIDLSAILAKPSALPYQDLSSGNAVVFAASNITYFLGRTPQNQVLIAASERGALNVTLSDSRLDLEGFARLSSNAKVSQAKTPVASWALEGNTDPIPHGKVSVLSSVVQELMGTTVGIAITSGTAAKRGVLTGFTTPLNIAGGQHGMLIVGLQWQVPESDQAAIMLGDDIEDEHITAYHDIAATTVYSAAQKYGVRIGGVDVHTVTNGDRGVKSGVVSFYVARNAANDVRFYFDYVPDPSTGVSGLAGSVQAYVEVFSLRTGIPTS